MLDNVTLPSTLVATVLFVGDAGSEGDASLGIDPQALTTAPLWKSVGIDIRPLNDVPIRLAASLRLLRKLGESFPSGGQPIGIFTDREEGRVIFLPYPRDADRAGVTAEHELVERMARFVKAELKRADLTYEQVADKLREMGHNETKISVANKINRGTFPATFFVAVMRAIGRESVNLADV